MKVYTIVIESRKTRDDETAIDIIPFSNKSDAKSHLIKLFDKVTKDRKLNLTDPKNDGICFLEDDYFSFYDWIGGDWVYKATIYNRTIRGKNS